ncbi:HTTM domain-containing protein [Algoriphagus sp. C2-6-M1]|nr:HTTM domain-containing protein [Algoriphagus sp. C2-6-M1]MEB2778977.1 HTTM domain-containing protein [Algoriphagus sp. C2-6-M1]
MTVIKFIVKTDLSKIINQPKSIAPLVHFRVLFGFIMLISILRFVWNGWIETQYLQPQFHFTYYGFGWVKPVDALGMYLLFGLMALSAIGIMIGLFYRLSALLFFLSFTYVELIDVTNYLNHYYFVSLMALLLVFIPANRDFSLDVWTNPTKQVATIPNGFILIIQLVLGLVYFYAGIAKLNPDWLLEALPLRIWLPPHTSLPLIGALMDELWVAYAFSWFGAIYDLSIPFLLFYRKTRLFAFIAVVVFHISTWLLFPIGMFPFIMILSTTIFFSAQFHNQILSQVKRIFSNTFSTIPHKRNHYHPVYLKGIWGFFTLFMFIQLLLPWRFALYPGNLFWTEQGYRFSWRVMLMEKAGYAIFHVKDPQTGKEWEEYARDYLTPMQEKQMSTQPDMILQFVHYLEEQMGEIGFPEVEIRAEVYVTLNGSPNKLLLDPNIDLSLENESFRPKSWVLPYLK